MGRSHSDFKFSQSMTRMGESQSDFKFMSTAALEEQKKLEKLKYKQVITFYNNSIH